MSETSRTLVYDVVRGYWEVGAGEGKVLGGGGGPVSRVLTCSDIEGLMCISNVFCRGVGDNGSRGWRLLHM